jgi:hypothetical protein
MTMIIMMLIITTIIIKTIIMPVCKDSYTSEEALKMSAATKISRIPTYTPHNVILLYRIPTYTPRHSSYHLPTSPTYTLHHTAS